MKIYLLVFLLLCSSISFANEKLKQIYEQNNISLEDQRLYDLYFIFHTDTNRYFHFRNPYNPDIKTSTVDEIKQKIDRLISEGLDINGKTSRNLSKNEVLAMFSMSFRTNLSTSDTNKKIEILDYLIDKGLDIPKTFPNFNDHFNVQTNYSFLEYYINKFPEESVDKNIANQIIRNFQYIKNSLKDSENYEIEIENLLKNALKINGAKLDVPYEDFKDLEKIDVYKLRLYKKYGPIEEDILDLDSLNQGFINAGIKSLEKTFEIIEAFSKSEDEANEKKMNILNEIISSGNQSDVLSLLNNFKLLRKLDIDKSELLSHNVISYCLDYINVVWNDKQKCTRLLNNISKDELLKKDKDGDNLFHYLAKNNKFIISSPEGSQVSNLFVTTFSFLNNKGININEDLGNQPNKNGKTPIHSVLLESDTEVQNLAEVELITQFGDIYPQSDIQFEEINLLDMAQKNKNYSLFMEVLKSDPSLLKSSHINEFIENDLGEIDLAKIEFLKYLIRLRKIPLDENLIDTIFYSYEYSPSEELGEFIDWLMLHYKKEVDLILVTLDKKELEETQQYNEDRFDEEGEYTSRSDLPAERLNTTSSQIEDS